MPNPICHNCAQVISLDVFTYWNYHGSVTCANCKSKMHVVIASGALLESEPLIKPDFIAGLHKGIPQQSYDDYMEALTCLVHQAYKASAVMARRSLQGALLARNVPEETPIKMIQWALSNQVLGQKQASLATTVTFFGGKGAHPQDSEINMIGELEATQGLRVTKELLVALYPPPTSQWVASSKVPKP